ncbi:MAG: hypothetical protein KatS3mg102_0453 [Planctomycetota bacterium]|nr:MAG: hypothetical protein KatS3mg102_0453 [Planctomycetota bacterium]
MVGLGGGRRWPGALALLAALLAGLSARAESPFERAWRQAGEDEAKKRAALALLVEQADEAAAKILVQVVLSPREPPAVALEALRALAALEGTAADRWIVREAGRAQRDEVRAVLVRAIARRQGAAAIEPLIAALDDRAWYVRAAAVAGLAGRRERRVVEALIAALGKLRAGDPETPRLASEIEDALYRLTGERLAGAEAWAGWWRAVGPGWTPPAAGQNAELIEHQKITVTREPPQLFRDVELASRRVVFVIDVSGSMRVPVPGGTGEGTAGRTRFELMIRELKQVIEALPRVAHFNIIAFSDEVRPWQKRLVRAEAAQRKAALAYLDTLAPEGQTNSYGALEAAFADPWIDTIFFLSDGHPTHGKTIDFTRILEAVERWNLVRGVRIHTIAFVAGDGRPLGITEDPAMAKTFMRELARIGAGRYRLVD